MLSPYLRSVAGSLLGRNRKKGQKRRTRVSRFEQLEARRVLAAAIWNNVGQAVNVNGDAGGIVSPIDALLVVNELNQRAFSSPIDGRLPRQIDVPLAGRFFDVSCDNFVSPLDALLVINHINNNGPNGGTSQGGVFPGVACSPQLLESTDFATELTQTLTLPDDSSAVRVHFQAPQFDFASRASIRDAFEIEITDLAGNAVAFPYLPDRDAVYNWSEDLEPLWGAGTATITEPAGLDSSATINLAGLPAGSQVRVTARLVNNDADNTTSIIVRGFEVIDSTETLPAGVPGSSARLAEHSAVDISQLTDLTSSFLPRYGRTTLSGNNNELATELMVTNRSNQAVTGQIIVAIDNISEIDASAMRPDGLLRDGRPYFDLTYEMNGQPLAPGESLRTREIRFKNNSGQRFSYKLSTYGRLNAAPTGFTSIPVKSIEAGKTYKYTALANDAENQPLAYSVIVGPEAMTIGADTGKLIWLTESADIGAHQVTIRATDPHGLYIEQSFTLEVLASLQNRPPNFVTDPVTDAIASSGFEITTVATGAQPSGVSVISGFQGPRLITINAGSQTVGVYAGQNNDRFDDATTVSTGEPRPTDAVFQSGYGVDVGLPPFQLASDTNDVLGMDQGDFNGDGILDLVAITSDDPSGATRPTYVFAILLGDGDGNFAPPHIISIAENVTAFYKHLNAADLNNDGHLDVIVLNETAGTVTTILGNGDGTFQPLAVQTLSSSMNDYRLADIDQDGFLDLYGQNFNRSAFGWMPGIGDATFGDFIPVSGADSNTNANTSYLTKPYQAIDLDEDGDLDFVIGKTTGSLIELWTNDGNQNYLLVGTLVGLRRASTQLQGVTDLRVADFTGDGKLDILYSGTNRSGYSIYVGNQAPLSFTYRDASGQIGNFAGEANPVGDDAPLDIDGDGDLDLVMGNGHAGEKYTTRVLINDGTGFFTSTDYASVDFRGQETEISQANDSTVAGVLVGDYNRDGVVDLSYFTRGGTDFNGVGVIPGTRPGEFYGSRTIDFPADVEALAADFNGDGIIDLLSIDSGFMLLGNGDGTYQAGFPAVSVVGASNEAQITDFNQDGILDLISTRSQGFYVALGNGNGTFSVSFNVAIPDSFYGYSHISNGDFNNDGLPDIIGRTGVELFIDVWLNQADQPGKFIRSFHQPLLGQGTLFRGYQYSVAEGDFNEDGFLDFAAGSLSETNNSLNSLKIFSGAGDGTFTLTHEQADYNDSFHGDSYHTGELVSGDVNEDGHVDIVSFTTSGPVVHLGLGDGTFQFLDQYFSDEFDSSAKDSYLVDMDEDGHLDMVQMVFNDSVNVRRGNGDGTFQDPIRVDSIGRTRPASFADLDHDGHLDLVYARGNTNGGGFYGAAGLYFGVRDGLVDILTVDLNGDGNEEVLAINEANDRLKLFTGDNLGGLNRQTDLLTGRAPRAVDVADLDGDGNLELITANRAGRSLSVFSGSVAAGYMSIEFPLENGAIDVAAADLDGDGQADVVALDDTDNALWIYAGNGTTSLAMPVSLALGDLPSKLTLADATGDGLIDAIVTLPESNRLMILPNRGLGFQPEIFGAPIYLTLSSSPSDVQVVDLNDDGNPDLAATLPNENKLSVLFGRGGNQFARAQQIAVGEQPTRVTLADADEDGRTDLIVSNSGDNTASVIYNRFDPNQVYRYDADAIDPDGDTLTYSIEDGPGGLIINSATGELLWAASPDQVGVHDVTLSADDGRGGIATQSFKIQVEAARENASPLIATEPVTKIGAGESFTYQASALDNDRDTVRYRLLDAPAGATIDQTTGLVEWDGRTDQGMIFGANGQSGSIEVSPNPSLKSDSITVEGWFNLHSLPRFQYLMLEPGRNGSAYDVRVTEQNEYVRVILNFDRSADKIQFDAPVSPEANRWYHVALTYDSVTGTATLYFDGLAVGSGTTPTPQPLAFDPTKNTVVGRNGASFTQATIDNYRIWNVVRTPEEIREGLGRHYEGDSRVVLDYRFDNVNSRSVRDYSPAGNNGYRIINSAYPELAPGLANPGFHTFTIGVEDGRGGFDTQSFEVEILPELRGSIRGIAFDDTNKNGIRDASENPLAQWNVFIDTNGNGYPDPSEIQTTTNATGNYQFGGLLPGSFPVRVSPTAGFRTPDARNVSVTANTALAVDLAIEQLALSQIRGQLSTQTNASIANWKVFADLDSDGVLDDNEPIATSDRNGNYAIAGLDAGTYTIRPELPGGWADKAGRNGLQVTLTANATSLNNNFTLEPTNTSVTGGVHFVTMPSTTLEARQTFRYAAIAMSIVDEAIAYDLSLAPEGMTVDPSTGLTAWRPRIEQVGEHLVILRATSASGSISLHDFYVEVTTPNTPPVITNIDQPLSVSPRFSVPSTAYASFAYNYDVLAQDADSTTLVFALTNAPAGATIDAATGRLSWTPAASSVGSHEFTVAVTDEGGATTSATWTVTVQSSAPATLPLNIILPRSTAAVTVDYFSRISGTDAIGRPVTWTLASGPTGMVVASDGTIQWTPAASQLGSQSIEINGATPDGTSESVSFNINVTGRALNAMPSIDSQPITSVSLGKAFVYDVIVTDTDRDVFAFTLLEAPVGMSVHSSLGTIRWSPAADQLGESNVVVQVADPNGDTATQEFKLKVSRFGGPPRITSVPPTEAGVGSAFLYSVIARDSEGDPLSYTLLAAPTGMTIVETTGEISWTPTAAQLGQQDVVIQVSDGIGGAATQAFAIRVSAGAPNLPPVITTTSSRFGAVGTAYSYTLTANDPESTTITYTLGRGPAGMTVHATTGLVHWTPTVAQAGKHVITLIATDTGGASAIESFEFDVLAQNTAPVINSSAPFDVAAGVVFMYDVLARDADLDQLRFEFTHAPAGATIDAFGRIRWQTAVALIGSHDFSVSVHDPRGGIATQSFTLSVIEDRVPPKLSLIVSPRNSLRPWQGPFRVYVRSIDNVAIASLTLSANGQDIPLDASGSATFTFEQWKVETILATATTVDTNNNIVTKQISFGYGFSGPGAEDLPTAQITSPAAAASVTGMVTISGTADHPDFGSYTLSYRLVNDSVYTTFHESDVAVTGGELGLWDTSLLLNDEYVIRLEVTTKAGVNNVVEHNVGLSGDLKLGNFRLSFTDMVIPVAGIPIEITRIYDTLQADRQSDFGYGWRLEYRNTDLRVGLPKSGLEDIGIYSPLRDGVKVYLNVPGEGRQGFTFTPDIRVLPGFGGNNLVLARPRFTPDPGVTSTLSTGTSSYLQVNEVGELHAPGGIPYNPASPDFGGAYVLTSREGLVYRIDGKSGKLNSVTDPNGTKLTFDDSKITFGDGTVAVQIGREVSGRITAITDLNGNSLNYAYDSGNLTAVTDREGFQTSFTYKNSMPHYLESIIDPLGRAGTRTEYDDHGRLIAIVDVDGNKIAFSSDPNSTIETVIDAMGNRKVVEYDNFGNVVGEIDALGGVTRRTYDLKGNLTSETDALGNTSRYEYDNRNNLTKSTDALGNESVSIWSRENYLKAEVSPEGFTVEYVSDKAGNPVVANSTLGNNSLSYSKAGRLISYTNSIDEVSKFQFDAFGNLVSAENATGARTDREYDSQGNLVSETVWINQLAYTSEFIYDRNQRMVLQRDPSGASTIYAYDAIGNQISATDALGQSTLFEYDIRNQLVRTTLPDSTPGTLSDNPVTSTTFDVLGRISATVDELGHKTIYEYDDLGRHIGTIFPDDSINDLTDNPRAKYKYDAIGNLISESDEEGNETQYRYNAVGDRISTVDAIGNETATFVDWRGQSTKILNASGEITLFEYNQLGTLLKTTFADGTSETRIVDMEQRLIERIDQAGNSTRYSYDKDGNLISILDALGALTKFAYDENGQILAQTDAIGHTTQYVYDASGRRIEETLPLGQTTTFEYDLLGNLVRTIRANGEIVEYSYDARNQVIRESTADEVESFQYDASGSRISMSDALGETTYEYDSRGRLKSKTDPFGRTLQYEYDRVGNVLSLSADSSTTRYTYNSMNQIASVTDSSGNLTTYGYDTNSRLVSTNFANGIVENRNYDSLDQLISIVSTRGSSEVFGIRYTLDSSGNRTRALDSTGRDVSYIYDKTNRLVNEAVRTNNENWQTKYLYDLVGNRLSKTHSADGRTNYEYDANDRLVKTIDGLGLTEYIYDDSGNQIAKSINGNVESAYEWSPQGELLSVTRMEPNSPPETTTYQYDADGGRVGITTASNAQRYLLEDIQQRYPQVLEQYSVHGDLTARYVYGNQVISNERGATTNFHLADALGSTRILTDAQGVPIEQVSYDAFGVLISPNAIQHAQLYTGEFLDAASASYFLRARYYDYETGRFVSRDPIDGQFLEPQTLHDYVYAGNNPTNRIDPSGKTYDKTIAGVLTGVSIISSVGSIVASIYGKESLAKNLNFISIVTGIFGAGFGLFGNSGRFALQQGGKEASKKAAGEAGKQTAKQLAVQEAEIVLQYANTTLKALNTLKQGGNVQAADRLFLEATKHLPPELRRKTLEVISRELKNQVTRLHQIPGSTYRQKVIELADELLKY